MVKTNLKKLRETRSSKVFNASHTATTVFFKPLLSYVLMVGDITFLYQLKKVNLPYRNSYSNMTFTFHTKELYCAEVNPESYQL